MVRRREQEAERAMVEGLPAAYGDALAEYRAQETLEARIVKAADKLQMMAKVLAYEAAGRGELEGFWGNPRNIHDAGLATARELFDAICEMRERRSAQISSRNSRPQVSPVRQRPFVRHFPKGAHP